MSSEAVAQLNAAGWYPGRAVDVSDEMARYKTDGYEITPQLIQFLTEFSGLVVRAENNNVPIEVDPIHLLNRITIELCLDYAALAGTALVPVAQNYAMKILLGGNGRFYGGYDDLFGFLGNTFPEVIDSIFNTDPPRPLDMRVPDW